MFDAHQPWINLRPSERRRRWLIAAAMLSLLLAIVCATQIGLTVSLGVNLAAAANAAAGIAIAFRYLRRDPSLGIAVRIDGEGTLLIRRADQDEPAKASFVSTHLLVLVAGDSVVSIWRDAVPIDVYRRLAVAARWQRVAPEMRAGSFEAAN